MTNPSTSAEQIIRQAKDLGCEILRSDSHVLIVKLAAGRDLTVKFDRSGRIREAAYDRDGIPTARRAIRPARVGAVLGVLFSEVYDAVHKPETEETTVTQPTPEPEQFRPERLIDFGRNALTVIPVNATTVEFDALSQRRIDWTAGEILAKSIEHVCPGAVIYSSQLISAAQRYDSTVAGVAHAAQVLAREAIRLALNERLAEIEAKTVHGTVLTGPGMPDPGPVNQSDSCEVGPMSVDIHGPWDRPVFKVGRWDNEEGAFVHVVSLSREEADALHTALGCTLLG